MTQIQTGMQMMMKRKLRALALMSGLIAAASLGPMAEAVKIKHDHIRPEVRDTRPPRLVKAIDPATLEAQNLWYLKLSNGGTVVLQLRPDKAPQHVERIRTLTRAGFYDNLTFHRVIEGFMAQGGDPEGTGVGGSPLPNLTAEFNDLPHVRGALAMARAQDKDSANSQFYIVLLPTLKLDGRYTVFGRVISGMGAVDAIAQGEPPENPTRIVHAWMGSDGPNAPRQPLPVISVTPKPAASPTPPPTPPSAN